MSQLGWEDRRWTMGDDQRLRQLYAQHVASGAVDMLAARLARTVDGIHRRAKQIGLIPTMPTPGNNGVSRPQFGHQTDGQRQMRALGRLKQGTMNKTEAAYAQHLEQRKAAGEILWYRFEGLKFRLADNTFYTPDFAVMLADHSLQCHEIKGSWSIFQDDARVKVKVAAEMYPIAFIVVLPRSKKSGGGWLFSEC